MRCLIIDEMHPSIGPLLHALGVEVEYAPTITRSEIKQILPQFHLLIVRSKTPIDADLLGAAPQLKLVARAGAGIDNLEMEALEKRGIAVVNASEGNRDAVGEHTLGLLLSLTNKIQKADKEIRRGVWDREGNRGMEVLGKTVGIIGYGHMGRSFARRLSGFGCRVLAYDKYLTNYSDEFAKEVSLNDLFEQTDILSLHIPLTSETKGLVDKYYLNRFHKDILFINTSRGEIVPLDHLVEALESGKVLGAGLDVLENEKLEFLLPAQRISFQKLMESPRVVVTPHVAGWSVESYERINRVLVEKIQAFLTTIL
jgi:D-3-phosphoglycerate dehydrogenase / 2-oxoglutarate reductase